MIAKLYNYHGEVKKINKELGTPVYVVNFQFLDNYDLQSPHVVILFGGTDNNGTAMPVESAFQVNYVTLEKENDESFNVQCYFVDKVIWQNNYLIEFALRKDVLMTYSSNISNLTGVLDRCEDNNFWTPDVVDELLPFTNSFKLVQELNSYIWISPDKQNHPSGLVLVITVIQDTFSLDEANAPSWGSPNSKYTDDGDAAVDWGVYTGASTNSTTYFISFNTPSDASKYINKLSQAFISDNTLVTSFVLGVWISPIPPSTFYTVPLSQVVPETEKGAFYIGVSGRKISPGSEGSVSVFNYNDSVSHLYVFKKTYEIDVLSRTYNDFRDFSPYTKICLSIPFYGDYEIDPSKLYNNNIPKPSSATERPNIVRVSYIFNFMDGTTFCQISLIDGSYTKEIVLDIFPVDVLIPVPLNSSTIDNVRRLTDANSFKTIAGAISGLTGIVIATAGIPSVGFGLSAVLGTGAVAGSLLDNASKQATNVPNGIKNYTSSNGYVALFNETLFCFLWKIYSSIEVKDLYQDSSFIHLYGRPSLKAAVVENVSDNSFVKFSKIHADIPFATSQEKEEIEKLLKEGCYK